MSITNLKQFIAQNDDFGFEMRVGAVMARSRASDVSHGATYTDPKTGLARQFDYRFKIATEERCVAFAAECKNINPDSPVTICGRKRAVAEAYHDIVVSHAGHYSTTSRVKRGLLYREDLFVGKSVLRPESLVTANLRARSNDGEI